MEDLSTAVNIYDLAHDLDKGIRETPEFISLQDAYREVNENADAKAKFERFRDVQVTIQEKQMTGQEIDDETVDVAQQVAQEVQENELIVKLMEKEQAMSTIINDLNRIIMTPLQDLYNVAND
ncbi:YlbF/YmcA family competence regulator [Listeria monocytogenes]|nr:YlbF/YmcA family competence regulator [Listeria monocytogenes]